MTTTFDAVNAGGAPEFDHQSGGRAD